MFISFLFHRIVPQEPGELMEVSEAFLRKCIDILKDRSIPVVNLSNCAAGDPAKGVSLTFDDGWESDYKMVFPLLKENGLSATFFITTSWIGKDGHIQESWLKEMSLQGMEIGSHTVTHRYLTHLSQKEVWEEFYNSKCKLEDVLSREVTAVSIPGGEYNKKTIDLAWKAGYKVVATSKPGINRWGCKKISRISIHAGTLEEEFERLTDFSLLYLYRLYIFYLARAFLKKALGVEGYKKLRGILIGR